MRPIRVLAVVALGLTAALVVPSHAATKPAPLVLRGDTTITADRTGQADVLLYDDALVKITDGSGSMYGQPTPDVSMTGKGRLFGFVLQGVGSDSLSALRYVKDGRAVTQTGANGTFYPEAGNCHPVLVDNVNYCSGEATGYKVALVHQGRYHLRVLTDGAPVTITLHLRGVTGRAHYRTSTPLAGGVLSVPALSLTARQYQRFETTLKLPATADVMLNVDAVWSRTPLAAGINWCDYVPGRPALPSDYALSCPAGQNLTGGYPFVNPQRLDYDPNVMFGLSTTSLDEGSHRVGFSATDSGGVTVRTALVGWLAQ
jgi:hypothetical protein